jgi:predicted ATPase/class 3 adenylate cyclase
VSERLALVFTDVVDSTQLNEQLGDEAMQPLWAAHDAGARALIRRWRGREIGRSDGFLVAFTTVDDAVAFALAYHRSLSQLPVPIRARVGVHWGPVTLRENRPEDTALGATLYEIDGVALPVAARVMAAAMGGQTLLTEQAAKELREPAQRLVSHGHWRFKGVSEPVEVFEIGDENAPRMPPPDSAKAYRVVHQEDAWVPLRELPHNLPAERDLFVGQAETLRRLARRFDDGARLVTLLGMGGIGKTRLARQYGRAWLGEYPGGVWFCDLSVARTMEGVVHAVAQALDVPLGSGDAVEQLRLVIAARGTCLLILDNFEQVAAYADRTLGAWLQGTPEGRFLVTSREVLGISGEQVFPVEALERADAERLFALRAAAAGMGSDTLDTHSGAISVLVELLEKIPLAIELAAARAAVLPPEALLQRMSQRFQLLRSGARHDRQATLRAVFDWSWELLSATEQSALVQLSVFEGGFTLESGEATTDTDGEWFPDVVQSLANKSWLRRLSGKRFGLLQSVREYAEEHASSPGRLKRDLEAARSRHWKYFATLPDELAACRNEMDNLVAACQRAAAEQAPEPAIALLQRSWLCLKVTGPFAAALPLIQALDGLATEGPLRADLAVVAVHVHLLLGRPDGASAWLQQGMLHARTPTARARLHALAADLMMETGRAEEAAEELQQGFAYLQAADDPGLRMELSILMGACAAMQSDAASALQHYRRALLLARKAGDDAGAGGVLGNIGEVLFNQGDLHAARAHFHEALAVLAPIGHKRWEGNTRCNLGLLCHALGDEENARAELERALQIARDIGHLRLEATVLCNLGITLMELGNPDRAIDTLKRAVSLAQTLGDPRAEGQFRIYLAQALARQGCLDDATSVIEAAERLLRNTGDDLSLVIALCTKCEVAASRKQMDCAIRSYREAQILASTSSIAPESEAGVALRRSAHAVQSQDPTKAC